MEFQSFKGLEKCIEEKKWINHFIYFNNAKLQSQKDTLKFLYKIFNYLEAKFYYNYFFLVFCYGSKNILCNFHLNCVDIEGVKFIYIISEWAPLILFLYQATQKHC